MNKVMIAVDSDTKDRFRVLKFPDYIKSDDARIRYIIAKFNQKE